MTPNKERNQKKRGNKEKRKTDTLYAGANFQNSPAPSALPIPKFNSGSLNSSPSPRFSALENRVIDSPVARKQQLNETRQPVSVEQTEEIFTMDNMDDTRNSLLEFMSNGGHKQIPINNYQPPIMHHYNQQYLHHQPQIHHNNHHLHHHQQIYPQQSMHSNHQIIHPPPHAIQPLPYVQPHPQLIQKKQELDSMSQNLKNILGL